MHRWVWDLHYPAPASTRHDYPISAIPGDTPRYPLGPTVLPGSYTARLTANGKSYTASFTVKMDPRVKTSAIGLEKKFELEKRLASSLSETSEAVLQAGSLRDSLQKLSQQASGETSSLLEAFQNKLAALLGGSPGSSAAGEITLTRVNGEVQVLYGQVWQADAEPTAAQSAAAASTESEASNAMKKWDTLKSSDLSALNQALRSANLPEVHVESDPRLDETGMEDEE